jgi:hypothetical protein
MKSRNMGKWKLAGAGIVFCGIGVFGAVDAMDKAGWRKADAQVTMLEVSCHMKATEHHVGYKTISEADIPCEAVEAFKILHADKTWSSTEQFDATLKVIGADGSTTTAQMDLHRKEGRAPAVGDAFPVMQNPAEPSKVAEMDSAGTAALIAAIFGGIGAVIMWFVFGMGGKPKRAPAIDEGADAEASARRADAMIAAAMAQMSKPPTQQPGKPSAGKPAPAMAAPRAAPMIQSGARASFGRKR